MANRSEERKWAALGGDWKKDKGSKRMRVLLASLEREHLGSQPSCEGLQKAAERAKLALEASNTSRSHEHVVIGAQLEVAINRVFGSRLVAASSSFGLSAIAFQAAPARGSSQIPAFSQQSVPQEGPEHHVRIEDSSTASEALVSIAMHALASDTSADSSSKKRVELVRDTLNIECGPQWHVVACDGISAFGAAVTSEDGCRLVARHLPSNTRFILFKHASSAWYDFCYLLVTKESCSRFQDIEAVLGLLWVSRSLVLWTLLNRHVLSRRGLRVATVGLFLAFFALKRTYCDADETRFLMSASTEHMCKLAEKNAQYVGAALVTLLLLSSGLVEQTASRGQNRRRAEEKK